MAADDLSAPKPAPHHRQYRAFISYSHRDKATVAWVHRELESYVLPNKLVGQPTRYGPAPKRLTPIFRDRDELPASGDLNRELTAALEGAMFLVVICSPASAKSRWVAAEIMAFKRLGREDRILALIVDGEPNAPESKADLECFPKPLRYALGPDGELSEDPAHPIAADMRQEGDGRRLARFKLIAGLTGINLDALVQRETQRRTRRLAALATASTIGMVFTGALALYANSQRIQAEHQRRIAEQESATARAASDYLVGTFELSNPATQNPRNITALTILQNSAERARRELSGQPVVQARLLGALGRAYNNLGLFRESLAALEPSLPTIARAGPDGADALLNLAVTYSRQGDADRALAMVRQARAALGPDLKTRLRERAQAASTEGTIYSNAGETKRADAAFGEALRLYRTAPDTPPATLARTLNNRGMLLSDDGQFAAAEASLIEANGIYRRTLGDRHLTTGKSWYALAQNAFLAGKLTEARTRIDNALAVERRVLDADNPTLADSLSMQGQILQAQGDLAAASRSLQEAISIYRRAFKRPHYQIGIAEIYLALIESAQGDTNAALKILDDAKLNYDVGYGKVHPNHGDLLVNRATILAKAGRRAEALKDCAAGIRILDETLGADASFTKSSAKTCEKL